MLNSIKRIAGIIFSVILVSCLAACSTEKLKRAGFETLQNVKQQQCQKESPEGCDERQSYDTYQDKLKESEK
jgi:uncharacterized lipoprotein